MDRHASPSVAARSHLLMVSEIGEGVAVRCGLPRSPSRRGAEIKNVYEEVIMGASVVSSGVSFVYRVEHLHDELALHAVLSTAKLFRDRIG